MTRRPGVTLVELIVALAMFSVLLVTTLGFYRQQGKAFTSGNERMTLMQNLRYGINALEQNLRTAGIGVPSKQPVLIYAGEQVLAFNANYASNSASDLFAVYREQELPGAAVTALTPVRKLTLPGTSFLYPDSAYFDGGGNSQAETITFFFTLDDTTARLDDFVLYRQVNDLAPEVIARHLLPASRPFFEYYVVEPGASGGPVQSVASARLPAAHTEPIHGSPGDTGAVALADSIRAVRVSYSATNGQEGDREARREITRLIRMPNAGVAVMRSCGNRPLLGTNLASVGVAPTATTPGHVLLSWGAATDEITGERDVMRYVIWRRKNTDPDWGDPLVSVAPGGATPYTYQDFSAVADQQYRYALAAQDCTPQYSTLSATGDVGWVP